MKTLLRFGCCGCGVQGEAVEIAAGGSLSWSNIAHESPETPEEAEARYFDELAAYRAVEARNGIVRKRHASLVREHKDLVKKLLAEAKAKDDEARESAVAAARADGLDARTVKYAKHPRPRLPKAPGRPKTEKLPPLPRRPSRKRSEEDDADERAGARLIRRSGGFEPSPRGLVCLKCGELNPRTPDRVALLPGPAQE